MLMPLATRHSASCNEISKMRALWRCPYNIIARGIQCYKSSNDGDVLILAACLSRLARGRHRRHHPGMRKLWPKSPESVIAAVNSVVALF